MSREVLGSRLWLIHFYQDQLDYFARVGLGKHTGSGVKVTKNLIEITKKRLHQLTTIYDNSLTPQAHALRRAMRQKLKEKLLNGSTNSNGAAETESCKDIRTNGHEGSKSKCI